MIKFIGNNDTITISGSCLNFEKEQKRILEFIKELEWGCHAKSECDVSSNGEALGWEFFQIRLNISFIIKLIEVHPNIENEDGDTTEQQFVNWLSKQLKVKKLEYYLKLKEIPQQNTQGFRLDPNKYRDDNILGDLK
ncbi:MAG: hypothetical protein ACPKPY_06140 [Nitrososphaeraceae archaeon]